MISNMNIFEGALVNQETNIANENIQQIIAVRIYDTETAVDNVYNLRFFVSNNGDGTQTVTILSDPFPANVDTVAFGYNDGSGWTDVPISNTGKAVIDIPEGDYDYSLLATEDSGATRIEFISGVTTDLQLAEPAVNITTIDNAEDPFTPIISKQAEINIYSGNGVGIDTFAEGGDNRFYVEVETQAEGIIFKGFLSTEDLHSEFLPDPNLIVLTATDGLGFLESEALVNAEGETPTDKQPIISFIVWALAKTGLLLDVKVCMNIRENTSVPLVSDDTGEGHFYKFVYLDAKTFEAEIGTCEDSYKVLEKILGENCRLFQYRGDWVILRVDELETGHEYFFTKFDYLGNFVSKTTETFSKDIGVNLPLAFMDDNADVSLVRPYKSIVETFKYNYPKELVCNIDFSRGVEVISAPDLTAPTSTGTYTTECWTMRRISGSITSETFIEKNFEYGYEKSRYLVITPKTGTATPYDFLQSSPIQVNAGDKIEFSVDWRMRVNIPGASAATYFPCLIYILAENGDRYYWYNSTTPIDITTFHWVFRSAGSGEANFYMPSNVPADQDYTEWVTVSSSLDQAPISGQLYIGLIQLHQGNDAGDDQDAFFDNLQVTIRPLINGSFQNYIGQNNELSQDNSKIKAVREKEVYVSDAPRLAMKGALLIQGAPVLLFTGEVSFNNANQLTIFSDVVSLFTIGSTILISGTTLNDGAAVILNVEFAAIPGDTTTLTLDKETFIELADPVTLSVAVFVLAGLFYNAALFTAGPGDLYTFGQLQATDVWNQFNRVMRTFEGQIDRTDSSTQIPDLLHKYILRDISPNTTNGSTQYRIFMLLHFEMDLHLCSWGAFFREVFNTDNPKTFETHNFKYITSEDA